MNLGRSMKKINAQENLKKIKKMLQNERKKSYWLIVAMIISWMLFVIVFNMM